MTTLEIEERLTRLEVEVKNLRAERTATLTQIPWWEQIRGTFKNDLAYKEAMLLGREWRQSEPTDSEKDAA